jgi:hypothetical protein
MDAFMAFFEQNSTGILFFLLTLTGVALLTQWFAWIFGWGRFKGGKKSAAGSTVVVFGDLMVKIIDDFRHLLALIVVLIFAVALGVAMFSTDGSVDELTKSMQVVVATLGGLVGSIIGYYFGESTVIKQQEDNAGAIVDGVAASTEQNVPETPGAAEDITPAPLPPPAQPSVDNPDAEGTT